MGRGLANHAGRSEALHKVRLVWDMACKRACVHVRVRVRVRVCVCVCVCVCARGPLSQCDVRVCLHALLFAYGCAPLCFAAT